MAYILNWSIGFLVSALIAVASSCVALGKDDAAFTMKFNESIKLAQSIEASAKIDLAQPEEGYYGCRWSGSTQTVIKLEQNKSVAFSNPEDSLPVGGYKGFDLFANGTVRLRKADGTF